MLRALSSAERRGLRADLTVAGGGASREFKALAGSLGLAVTSRGAVSDGEMGELYGSSDALIHPTFADHCSLVVLEALASGLPVITTRQNGAAELMESGRQGSTSKRPARHRGVGSGTLAPAGSGEARRNARGGRGLATAARFCGSRPRRFGMVDWRLRKDQRSMAFRLLAITDPGCAVSTRHRVTLFEPYLRRHQIHVETLSWPRRAAEQASLLELVTVADAVVFQRYLPTRRWLRQIRQRARRLVYDFDDAIIYAESTEPPALVAALVAISRDDALL